MLEDYLPTFKADGHREGDRALLLADWSQTPEDELLSGEARAILEEGLALLPEHYRAILVLRDVEELPNEEVAEVLGEPVSTVKSRLHRARMALREVLTRRLAPASAVWPGGPICGARGVCPRRSIALTTKVSPSAFGPARARDCGWTVQPFANPSGAHSHPSPQIAATGHAEGAHDESCDSGSSVREWAFYVTVTGPTDGTTAAGGG